MAKKKATHGGKREGAGRRKKYGDGKAVTFYLPAEAIEALDAQATAAGVSRSEVIVALLLKTKAVGQAVRDGMA